MTFREERIGGQRLILGDCLDVMLTLGNVDAVVTDPPYGIDYGGLMRGKGDGVGGLDKNRWKHYKDFSWDNERPAPEIFKEVLNCSKNQIIWGGNYFADLLPPKMGWLVWDKMQRDFSLADFELAWTNRDGAGRAISYSRPQALRDGRHHPTQKPVAVMEWCLGFLPDARTILDPFMGSGTTLVACQKLGRNGIGIEIDPDYFEIACKRVDEATRQPDLFIAPTPKPEQTQLFPEAD